MYSAFIEQLLFRAGSIAKMSFGKVSGVIKSDDHNQVLTQTDQAIGQLLVETIERQYPNHNIIDEEYGVIYRDSQYTWVTDPIDGTSNFAAGLPMYGIMIGLLKDSKPVAGGIYLPYFDELYIAEQGKGTYCNGKPVKMNSIGDLKTQLLAYGIDGHPEQKESTYREGNILANLALNVRNIRMSNSVYDIAQVLKGRYAGFINHSSKVWDNVAQEILIKEAGGQYTDWQGKEVQYEGICKGAHKNFSFIAVDSLYYDSLIKILGE